MFTFSSGQNTLIFRTAAITGVCRSGKTLLGNLLATCGFVEHADEPWLPMLLPVMAGLRIIDEKLAEDMFVTYTAELFNGMVLLRWANFRPGDLSSIWKQKTQREILMRLTVLNSRSEVRRFAIKYNSLLLYNLAETMPYLGFIAKALPNSKFIHLVRRGFDLAHDIVVKRWYSNERLWRPTDAYLYHKYKYKNKEWYLQWWVDQGDEKQFIEYSDCERGLYYWCSLIEKGIFSINKLTEEGRCITLRYEDLIKDLPRVIDYATRYLRIKQTALTRKSLKQVYIPQEYPKIPVTKISSSLYKRVFKLYRILGYDIERV